MSKTDLTFAEKPTVSYTNIEIRAMTVNNKSEKLDIFNVYIPQTKLNNQDIIGIFSNN